MARRNAFNIPGQNYWWAIKNIATTDGIMSEDSGRFLLLQKKIIQITVQNNSALVLWTVCTSACAKPIPEIVPMAKLHSLMATLIKNNAQ